MISVNSDSATLNNTLPLCEEIKQKEVHADSEDHCHCWVGDLITRDSPNMIILWYGNTALLTLWEGICHSSVDFVPKRANNNELYSFLCLEAWTGCWTNSPVALVWDTMTLIWHHCNVLSAWHSWQNITMMSHDHSGRTLQWCHMTILAEHYNDVTWPFWQNITVMSHDHFSPSLHWCPVYWPVTGTS